jgi:hypothetical protein
LEHGVFPLELQWPARSRGLRRRRKAFDRAINLVQ